jgi:hypothetical protein
VPDIARKELAGSNRGTLAASRQVLLCSRRCERYARRESMHHALVSDLVTIVRRSLDDPGRPLEAELGRALAGRAVPAVTNDLEELVRRARGSEATDEELSLAIGAVLAMSEARPGTP